MANFRTPKRVAPTLTNNIEWNNGFPASWQVSPFANVNSIRGAIRCNTAGAVNGFFVARWTADAEF
jgi:hypothetical protein